MRKKLLLTLSLSLLLSVVGCAGGNNESSGTSSSESSSSQVSSQSSQSSQSADYVVTAVNDNANIAAYKENIGANTVFKKTSERLTVGDDNAFNMKPVLKIVDNESGDPASESVWQYDYEAKVEEITESGNKAADKNDYSFDAKKCSFDFAESAIGKSYKLSVTPGGLKENQKTQSKFTNSIEINVEDGFNVYSADELAYFNDDRDVEYRYCAEHSAEATEVSAAWKQFKTSKGLDLNYYPNNLFLQTDINITKDNVPDIFFFKKGEGNYTEGSLKDTSEIYFRIDTNTIFNGNYFDINTANFPLAGDVRSDWDNISHSTLFKFYSSYSQEESTTINIQLKNFSYYGNGPRSSDDTCKGGLIFAKFDAIDEDDVPESRFKNKTLIVADNTVTTRAVITYFGEAAIDMEINDSVGKENYNSFFYLWGSSNLTINDSEFKSAGGPVILSSILADRNPVGFPEVTVNRSVLESWVVGSEPWFVNVGATAVVPQLKEMNGFFAPFGKSFLRKNSIDATQTEMNLVSVCLSGSSGASRLGTIQFDNSLKMGTNNTAETQEAAMKLAIADAIQSASGQQAVFQTSAGGFAYAFQHQMFNEGNMCLTDFMPNNPANTETEIGAAIMGGTFPNLSTIEAYTNAIYQGDYLNLYTGNAAFGSLNITLGYGPSTWLA